MRIAALIVAAVRVQCEHPDSISCHPGNVGIAILSA